MNNRKDLDDQKLYLMVNEIGRYKIGVSNDPLYRRKTLEMGGGTNVEILKVWNVYGAATGVERELHKRYSDKRLMGEWFNFEDVGLVIDHINTMTNLILTNEHVNQQKVSVEARTHQVIHEVDVKPPTSNLTGRLLVKFKNDEDDIRWHIVNNLSEVKGDVLICEKLGVVK